MMMISENCLMTMNCESFLGLRTLRNGEILLLMAKSKMRLQRGLTWIARTNLLIYLATLRTAPLPLLLFLVLQPQPKWPSP